MHIGGFSLADVHQPLEEVVQQDARHDVRGDCRVHQHECDQAEAEHHLEE